MHDTLALFYATADLSKPEKQLVQNHRDFTESEYRSVKNCASIFALTSLRLQEFAEKKTRRIEVRLRATYSYALSLGRPAVSGC